MEFRPSNGIQERRAAREVIRLDDLRKNLAAMRRMETNNTLLTKPFDIDIAPRIMGVEIIGLPVKFPIPRTVDGGSGHLHWAMVSVRPEALRVI
jgi:hypothetical protein